MPCPVNFARKDSQKISRQNSWMNSNNCGKIHSMQSPRTTPFGYGIATLGSNGFFSSISEERKNGRAFSESWVIGLNH
jgi:hypothetical protein